MRVRLFAADAAGELTELDAGAIDPEALIAEILADTEAAAIRAAVRACVWGDDGAGNVGAVA